MMKKEHSKINTKKSQKVPRVLTLYTIKIMSLIKRRISGYQTGQDWRPHMYVPTGELSSEKTQETYNFLQTNKKLVLHLRTE
jgi:hypothetical protein